MEFCFNLGFCCWDMIWCYRKCWVGWVGWVGYGSFWLWRVGLDWVWLRLGCGFARESPKAAGNECGSWRWAARWRVARSLLQIGPTFLQSIWEGRVRSVGRVLRSLLNLPALSLPEPTTQPHPHPTQPTSRRQRARPPLSWLASESLAVALGQPDSSQPNPTQPNPTQPTSRRQRARPPRLGWASESAGYAPAFGQAELVQPKRLRSPHPTQPTFRRQRARPPLSWLSKWKCWLCRGVGPRLAARSGWPSPRGLGGEG